MGKILLVDEDFHSGGYLVFYLQLWGHEVGYCRDKKKVLERVVEMSGSPDLIILDECTSNFDPYKILDELRRTNFVRRGKTPVLLITKREINRRKMRSYPGKYDFTSNPYFWTEVQRKVNSLIN